jgi:thymidylate synthase
MYKVENIAEMYHLLGKELLANGEIVRPRGKETREIITPVIHIENPRGRLAFEHARKFSIVYAVVESLMLVSKNDDVRYFKEFNKNVSQFSDDGIYFHGNYGRRIADNINSVVYKLLNDKDSRQAVLSIYENEQDCYYQGKDTPCTLSLHFMIRNNKLNMITYMRSNDIIWGTPYDIYIFTNLQEVIANEIGIDVGYYRHVPSSLHVYEEHYSLLDLMSRFCEPVYVENKCNLEQWRRAANEYEYMVNTAVQFPFKPLGPIDEFLNIIRNEYTYKSNFDNNSRYLSVPEWANKFTTKWVK